MARSARIQTATVTIFVAVTMLAVICGESDGRELRPSDHGLDYQTSPPPGKTPRETASFFGGVGDSKESSPSVALPEATMRSNDTSWWTNDNGGGGGSKIHLRHVLLLASVGCGITGVALLLASAFIYVVWHKRKQRLTSSSTSRSPPQSPPERAIFDVERK